MDDKQSQISDQNTQGAVAPTPPSAVGTPHKEHAPVVANENLPAEEFVKPVDQEPTLPEEVKEAGVEAKHEAPKLTNGHKQAGIFHAPEIMTVQQFTPTVKYILTSDEEKSALRRSPLFSIRWLAALHQKVREQLAFFGKS